MSGAKTGYLDSIGSGQAVSIQSPKVETVIYDELDTDTGEAVFRCSSCGVDMTAELKELSGFAMRTGNSHHIDSIPNDKAKISPRVTWWVTLWWTLYLGCMSCLLLLGMNMVFR